MATKQTSKKPETGTPKAKTSTKGAEKHAAPMAKTRDSSSTRALGVTSTGSIKVSD